MLAQNLSTRCSVCPTRPVCLAKDLDESDRGRLEEIMDPFVCVETRNYLYRAGDVASHHYHVRSGMFKTYTINSNGDEYVTGFYLPGQIIGCAQIDGKHTESAIALETSSACRLLEKNLNKLSSIGIASTLFRLLAEREVLRNRHILNLNQTRAEARVTGFLIDMSGRFSLLGRCPDHISTPMSRTDIANYLGMTLETLSRALARLVKTGVLQTTKDYIKIKQPETVQLLGLHMSP